MSMDLSQRILRAATALDRQNRGLAPQMEWIEDLAVEMLSRDFVGRWGSPRDLAAAMAPVATGPIVTMDDLKGTVHGFGERLRARLDVDASRSLQACLAMHELACRPNPLYQP